MSKNDSSSESEADAVLSAPQTPVEETGLVPTDESASAATETEPPPKAKAGRKADAKPAARRSWLGLFNFLLIIALIAAGAYYWRLQQQVAQQYQSTISELNRQIEARATSASIEASLAPLKSDIIGLGSKIGQFEQSQQDLQASSEKLYQLFGRDKNDWQLAEVEYLMRVAQHKLILQNDFEGAAITLQVASDQIALTGDPGLLPVRVSISEEIALLKTRARPDLVGTTLILSQLGRQLRVLKPGFAPRTDAAGAQPQPAPAVDGAGKASWIEQLSRFVDSLVQVRYEATKPSEIEANIIDVSQVLEDNLKLARWAVLERDAQQYQQLIGQSLRLFGEFYNLDDAANHDFYTQLQSLQQQVIKPELPDINGSLQLLQLILSKRENAPESAAPAAEVAQ